MNIARDQAKERMRGPHLEVFVKPKEGIPMVEALQRADTGGRVILSNNRLDSELVNNYWHGGNISRVLTCWGGTMVGYDEPGKKLNESIEYTDENSGIRFVFPVPKELQGMEDIVLAVEHPDYAIEKDKNNLVVRASEVGFVPEFPGMKESGRSHWHHTDERFGIPTGKEVRFSEPGVRLLFRINKRVGLIARADHYFHGPFNVPELKMVGLSSSPSDKLGVPAESDSPSRAVRQDW